MKVDFIFPRRRISRLWRQVENGYIDDGWFITARIGLYGERRKRLFVFVGGDNYSFSDSSIMTAYSV